MKDIYKDYLFNQHYFITDKEMPGENWFETMFALAHFFGIELDKDSRELASEDMIEMAEEKLGVNVPEPFYRGFPESVRKLSSDELLFDQLLSYFLTYGINDFEGDAIHSIFEGEAEFKRTAFKENVTPKKFSILTETEAEEKIAEIINNLLASTRPLNDTQYQLFVNYYRDYGFSPTTFASKNTLIKFILDTRNISYARFMSMSDVIKLVDEMNWTEYQNKNIKKLNLKNKDRKFITSIIDELFKRKKCDTETCHEKKKIWCGLLHHIHYQPKNQEAKAFVHSIRNKGNLSAYSQFEHLLAEGNIGSAVKILKQSKGTSAVLRNFEYILSRCSNLSDIGTLFDSIQDTTNIILLLQLLMKYVAYDENIKARIFKFTKYNQLITHKETADEVARRKTKLPQLTITMIQDMIKNQLNTILSGKLDKAVYIDPEMERYALPLQENTTQLGFGVLSKGSRLPIPEGKKVRAFTYWEKVNDIDLSCFGINGDNTISEFSWRTMAIRQSSAITFSGDETRGYNGGSEFFDIDLDAVKERYPNMRYMIFCDNVYSRVPFDKCFCKAGYMIRDVLDSGKVYEPKTVESAYRVQGDTIFSYMFGIDLDTREMVWLNLTKADNYAVAGQDSIEFIVPYFYATKCINMQSFFTTMAAKVVDDPKEAYVIVTNKDIDTTDLKEEVDIIREYDFDKVLALMNTI